MLQRLYARMTTFTIAEAISLRLLMIGVNP